MTLAVGSMALTAAMKSGLSCPSKRSAQVEHGIRNAMTGPSAAAGATPVAAESASSEPARNVDCKRDMTNFLTGR